jgi:hypothetical protein
MRLLLEILIIGVLIWAAWEKPFRDWLPSPLKKLAAVTAQPTPSPTPAPTAAPQLHPTVRSTPSGSWMWDPQHRSVLDVPRKGESLRKP